MNLKRIKTAFAAGVLAASMIVPNMGVMAATVDATDKQVAGDANVIKKTIKSAEGVSYADQTFTFTFTQDALNSTDSGVTANLKSAAIPAVTTDNMSHTASTNDDSVVTNSNTKALDLSKLDEEGVYTYTVTETAHNSAAIADAVDGKRESDAKGTVWQYSQKTYKLRVYVTRDKNDASKLVKKMTIVDDSLTDDGENYKNAKSSTAEFENLLTKRGGSGDGGDDGNTPDPEKDQASLTISKTVSDSTYEPNTATYTFKITFTESDFDKKTMGKTNTYSYYIVGADGNRGDLKTDFTSGSTITIKNGEKIEFYNIYAGTKVDVEESYVTNLTQVKITNTSNGETSEATTISNVTSSTKLESGSVLIGQGTNSIAYENKYQDVTVTGVVTDIAPYITLVVVAVAAIAAYIGFKKRIAR